MFGDNTESLLIAADLNEIQLIGQALGSTYAVNNMLNRINGNTRNT